MNAGRWRRIAASLVKVGMAPSDARFDGFLYESNAPKAPLDLRWVIGSGGALLALAALVLFSNLRVRRLVRLRTQELRASEAEFRALTDSVPQIVWIAGADGGITYVNQRWADYSGLPLEQGRGDGWIAIIHPDDRAHMAQAWQQSVATGQVYGVEGRIRRADGEYHWWLVRGLPVRDATGSIVKWIGTSTDFHDIRQAQNALRESESRYRAILETTSDVVVMMGGDQCIHYISQAAQQTFGYSPEELLGQSLELLQPERLWEMHRQAVQRYLATGERTFDWKARQITARHRDGREFPVELSLADLQMGGERMFVGFIRDISERSAAEKRRESLEAQLRESQKMEAIGTLAGGVAHDFNNMLGAILGNVQLASEEAGDNPPLQESLEEIRKAGHRARELVRQILSFSQRQPVLRQPCALLPIVEESILMLRASLPAQVVIDVQCAADVPVVLVDAVQVEQVLLNLGTNAAQAMEGRPGRIDIRIEPVVLDAQSARVHAGLKPGRYARVSCSDTGHGMDAETLERLFEPFFTTKSVGEGTGLGLSVAHGILSAHGGAIVAHSEPGRGSRFDLYFPAAADETAAAPVAQPSAAAQPVAGAGQHILCIDDEEGLVFLLKRMLERRGYRVTGHVDARRALEELRADPASFDLVVTDHNMPGMSGLDVARAVRAIRPDLPVAVASGYITDELQRQAPAAGVRELIFKADVVEDYCDMVQRLVPPRS